MSSYRRNELLPAVRADDAHGTLCQMPDGEVRRINLTEVAYPEDVADV